MKLIIMTKPTFFVEEDKIISTLFEEGMESLHLYKPDSEPIYSERLLTLLPDTYYNKVTVHGHFYLKEEYRLRGIHLDGADMTPPDRYKGHLSYTCDRIEELKDAKKRADYVFLRDVFDGLSTDHHAAFSDSELQAASRHGLIDKHVYALGGVNMENIRRAKDLGFGGVVVCGDLWNRFDIHHELNYKDLIAHFDRLHKTVN